ncbi:MAG: imidazole glycerol phosphate synthase subunit HisH [Candidatus Omnitrophica bacterium]|nr:imidazole glycerol phosphate synthase subunit HisH [Candidatus Omnitrophota bacterium]
MIIVIDYGMGNLHSVRKALEVAGARAKVSSCAEEILKADKIVFPGVGSFGEAMKELNRRKLTKPIKDAINGGKPFLGLCLGLQLLFERSEEAPGVKGLGILRGEVKKFKFSKRNTQYPAPSGAGQAQYALKVPHMGWNSIAYIGQRIAYRKKILAGVLNGSYMYFVHSYYVKPKDKKVVLTTTNYGIDFASGVCKDNVYAFQFHPEKSQAVGLRILKNFVRLRI